MRRGIALYFLLLFALLSKAQISITSVNLPVTQVFSSLAASGTSSVMPAGWVFLETGSGSNTTYTANTGLLSTNETYSYGIDNVTTERALGEITGTILTTMGASFTNNTGVSITNLMIQYTGEQWRLGALGRLDKLDFEYSLDATSLTTGSWTAVNALDFTAPVTAGTVGALNGNLIANQSINSSIITSLSIANGAIFWIRWLPFDATGADDGLSIDDFSLSANPIVDYDITLSGGALTVTDLHGNGEALSMLENGASLRYYAKGRAYSFNSGALAAFPFDQTIAGVSSLTINLAGGSDTMNINAFTNTLPSLTVNGGSGSDVIQINGDINFNSGANLNLDLQNDDPTPGTDQINFAASANLILSGTGAATLKVSRNIALAAGASLVTVNGDLTMEANQQSTSATGSFFGIAVSNALVETTGTGLLYLNGRGGDATSAQNGVNIASGGDVIGGTTGTTSINGTGGSTFAGGSNGVNVTGSGSTISTHGSIVSVIGVGDNVNGAASSNIGVQVLNGGIITGGGTASVNINGTGGTSSVGFNDGVRVTGAGATITSTGGNVSVTGLGNGSNNATGCNGVNVATSGLITAGGNGTVTVLGTGGVGTATNNNGVFLSGNATITSNNGTVTVTGTGGGNAGATNCYGVYILSGTITAGGTSAVFVTGTGGPNVGSGNYGVQVLSALASITSGGGNVTVQGTGGGISGSSTNYGIILQTGGSIKTTSTGDVSLTGHGGPFGGANHGILIANASSVSTVTGNISLSGTGGGNASSGQANNYGIDLILGGIINCTNTGVISLSGSGGLGTSFGYYGLLIDGTGTMISNANGDINITGTGGGNSNATFNSGISITNSAQITGGLNTDINLTGVEGIGTSTYGIVMNTSAAVNTSTNGESMYIKANSLSLTACTLTTPATKTVTLDSYTAGVNIQPGDASADILGGPLKVSDAELDMITTGTLVIGSNTAGIVSTEGDITRPASTNMILRSANNIITNNGLVNTNGGTLLLDPGIAPTAVFPRYAGTDVICSTLSFSGNIQFEINGIIPETDYEQLTVTGAVNLTGATLAFSGTYTPMGNQTFTLINNDGADAIIGTFTGLPQGATIVNFLGSNLPATISYTGGTGNDVVITVGAPDYTITNNGDYIVVTDIAGNADAFFFSQNGTNFRFNVTSRTFSLNGNTVTNFPSDIASAGIDSISINTGNGNDNIQVSAFSFSMPTLTINGGKNDETISINGDLTFLMNSKLDINMQNDDPTPGVDALTLNNADILCSGTGSIDLQVSKNISLNNSSLQTSNGNITVKANDQVVPNTGSFNGVLMSGSVMQVTGSGNLLMKGKGGNTAGIIITAGSDIIGGTTGTNTVIGTGGTSAGSAYGIIVSSSSSSITSFGGDVSVTGIGGGSIGSGFNYGVAVFGGGQISAGGSGDIAINGTGGATQDDYNIGVAISDVNSAITSSGGDVTMIGAGGGTSGSDYNWGIWLASGALIQPGGTGTVTLNGTGGTTLGSYNYGVHIQFANALITSSGGNVTVSGIGGGTAGSAYNDGVILASGGAIKAGGNGTTTVTGNGGQGTGNGHLGVTLLFGCSISSTNGNVFVNGTGGGVGTGTYSNYGVEVNQDSKIEAGGTGNVEVTGYGGVTGADVNVGVMVQNSNAKISTNGGNILINGFGGGADVPGIGNSGVAIQNQGAVLAKGSGTVTINGTAGLGTGFGNEGVLIWISNARVASEGGDITIHGIGTGSGNSFFNPGIFISESGRVDGGPGADIQLIGEGGVNAGFNNYGLSFGTDASVITTNGNILMSGKEGMGDNALSIGMQILDTIKTIGSGDIELIGNSMALSGKIITPANQQINIHPLDPDVEINLGQDTDIVAGPLSLTDFELDSISTGTIIIGQNNSGKITISDTITRSQNTFMQLNTNDDVSFEVGSINTLGGNLELNAGSVPKGILPGSIGQDVIVNQLILHDRVIISIDGTILDSEYTQFNIAGLVNLTGISLQLTGSYAPVGSEVFMIVKNDAADPVTGIFTGLSEGATISNFLGSSLDASITYVGGDGNDVVINVESSCHISDVPTLSATPMIVCAGATVNLLVTGGNLWEATAWHWYAGSCNGTPVGVGNSIMVNPSLTTTYFARGEGGCVTNATCGQTTATVNPYPDATIQQTFSSPCYFSNRIFQPQAPLIPGATYQWNFGANAVPLTATGYGPHTVYYTVDGTKSVKLVIYPNAPGAQCPDSSTLNITVTSCPGQIIGVVKGLPNIPLSGVGVKLFEDNNTDGMADNSTAIRNVTTGTTGLYVMSSLTPGSYVIVETQPNGWNSFDDGDSSFDGDIVSNNDSLDNIIPLTIGVSEVDSMNNFIEIGVGGTITGTVFIDYDGDMAPDVDEGIPNVSLKLYNDNNADGIADNGTPVMTQINNTAGNYVMPGIPTGNYVLVENTPANMVSIKDFDPTNDNDVVPNTNMNNDTIPVTLTNNETDANNFFIDVPVCTHIVWNANDSGYGSLRNAIDCAMNGDTIRFHTVLTGATIDITSALLNLDQNMVILSSLSPRITISSELNGLFVLQNTFTVEMKDVNIISGIGGGSAGAAIDNFGILKLNGVNITRNPSFPTGQYLVRNHPMASSFFVGSCSIKMN